MGMEDVSFVKFRMAKIPVITALTLLTMAII